MTVFQLKQIITLCEKQIEEIQSQENEPNRVSGLEKWIRGLSFSKDSRGFKLLVDRDSGAAYWIRPEEG